MHPNKGDAPLDDAAKIAWLEDELKAAKTLLASYEKMLEAKCRTIKKMQALFTGIKYVAHYVSRQAIAEIAEVGEAVPDGNQGD